MMTLTAADITARIARSIRLGRELANHMSQDALAAGVNRFLGERSVRRNEVRRWERGTRPREYHLIAIASVLGVDYAWLFAEHDDDELDEEATG